MARVRAAEAMRSRPSAALESRRPHSAAATAAISTRGASAWVAVVACHSARRFAKR